jgi:hypothetical protein
MCRSDFLLESPGGQKKIEIEITKIIKMKKIIAIVASPVIAFGLSFAPAMAKTTIKLRAVNNAVDTTVATVKANSGFNKATGGFGGDGGAGAGGGDGGDNGGAGGNGGNAAGTTYVEGGAGGDGGNAGDAGAGSAGGNGGNGGDGGQNVTGAATAVLDIAKTLNWLETNIDLDFLCGCEETEDTDISDVVKNSVESNTNTDVKANTGKNDTDAGDGGVGGDAGEGGDGGDYGGDGGDGGDASGDAIAGDGGDAGDAGDGSDAGAGGEAGDGGDGGANNTGPSSAGAQIMVTLNKILRTINFVRS